MLYLSVPGDRRKLLEVTVGGRAADLGKVKGFKKQRERYPEARRKQGKQQLSRFAALFRFFFGGGRWRGQGLGQTLNCENTKVGRMCVTRTPCVFLLEMFPDCGQKS